MGKSSSRTKDQIVELFLVFMIFCGVRVVMLSTGIVFIYIPILDPVLYSILQVVHDPEYRTTIKIWWQKQMFKWSGQ